MSPRNPWEGRAPARPLSDFSLIKIAAGLILSVVSSLYAAEPLVLNGDLEKADPADATQPLGWDKTDGLGVQWASCPDGPDVPAGPGKNAIRMDTALTEQQMVAQWTKVGMTEWIFPKPAGNAIAETYGLSLYSQAMPVEAGRTYRVTVRYKGSGGAKVWVRGYGVKSEQSDKPKRLYESMGACPAAVDHWGEFTQDFNPTKHTPKVTTMKVMLFAYYPAGVSWFDNISIVALPAADEPGK